MPYGLADLEADLASGHHIIDTVFVECHSSYRADGPTHLRPVGETDFVAAASEASTRQVIGGIVAHADLTDAAHLDEVLDAHVVAARGRLRGIRHAGCHALHPEVLMIPGRAPAGLYADESFRTGVRRLGERGLTYDTWHYHYQNIEFAEFARAVPDTTIVLDHFGTPLGVGPYAGRRADIAAQWRTDVADIATIPNVVAKLGGLAMPDNGFGWNVAERPPTSDEFVDAQAPLLPPHDRVLRRRAVHVRVELPGRPIVAVVPHVVERAEEDRRHRTPTRNGSGCSAARLRRSTASTGDRSTTWSRGLGRWWRRLCTPPPPKGRSMTANSVLTHRNVGVLAVNAVEAPEVVTSQWIDDQLAETYDRTGLKPGTLTELAGIEARRWWPEGMQFDEAAAMAGRAAIDASGDRSRSASACSSPPRCASTTWSHRWRVRCTIVSIWRRAA